MKKIGMNFIWAMTEITHWLSDKEPVQKALLTLGEEPKTALMIGDTIMDALSAKAAGAMAFGVLCGYGKEKDLKEHCDYVFADTLAAVKFALKNH